MTGEQKPCCECDYRSILSAEHTGDLSFYCRYLEVEGRRRPCPPGKGCTEFKLRGPKRRPTHRNDWPHEAEARFYEV